jgi:hypothetical protein
MTQQAWQSSVIARRVLKLREVSILGHLHLLLVWFCSSSRRRERDNDHDQSN